jgi:hypothetical protein
LANDLPAGFALLFHYVMHRYAPWKVDYSGSALTGGALPLFGFFQSALEALVAFEG